MITDTYIKMCEASEELQREWEKLCHKWLPTLEQLFEMVLTFYDGDEPTLLGDLMEFIELGEYGRPFKENLLVFYYEVKYHKAWTGEKWEVK